MDHHRNLQKLFSRVSAPGGSPGARETVLLCGGKEFCAELRQELLRRRPEMRVATVGGAESARRRMGQDPAAVIAVEERALVEGAASQEARRKSLEDILVALAGLAPLVWIGGTALGPEPTPKSVDFVPPSALWVCAAATMIERKLRCRTALPAEASAAQATRGFAGSGVEERDFGELLRHELNNPLTGILGNAELLLLEARRGKVALPPHALGRLETITALAVRMRETVRRLSDRLQVAGESETQQGRGAARWPITG